MFDSEKKLFLQSKKNMYNFGVITVQFFEFLFVVEAFYHEYVGVCLEGVRVGGVATIYSGALIIISII